MFYINVDYVRAAVPTNMVHKCRLLDSHSMCTAPSNWKYTIYRTDIASGPPPIEPTVNDTTGNGTAGWRATWYNDNMVYSYTVSRGIVTLVACLVLVLFYLLLDTCFLCSCVWCLLRINTEEQKRAERLKRINELAYADF